MSADDCGCCEGIGIATPDPLDTPPGLPALPYRVGTYSSFFRIMMARLSSLLSEHGVVGSDAARTDDAGCLGERHRSFLLGGEPDAGTALLDGWACIADILTFYQERIANEGYLRTATEQRSVIELGRLTGYEPRPGVAASVYLAFSVQDGFDGEVPERTRTQSLPRPDQQAQLFETSVAISARAEWNAMRASRRATGRYIRREYRAVRRDQIETGDLELALAEPTGRIEIFLEGVGQNVQVGDVLTVVEQERAPLQASQIYRATEVSPDGDRAHTTVRLVPFSFEWKPDGEWDFEVEDRQDLDPFANPTRRTATRMLARSRRTIEQLYGAFTRDKRDHAKGLDPTKLDPNALTLIGPGMIELRDHLRTLIRTLQPEPPPEVHVLRTKAQVFGHAVPPIIEITIPPPDTGGTSSQTAKEHAPASDEERNVVYLAGEYVAIRAGSPLVMHAPVDGEPSSVLETRVFTASAVDVQSRMAYGAPGKTTRVELSAEWWRPPADGDDEDDDVDVDITRIRRALVYAQPEPLALVGEPLSPPVEGATIDLDSVVDDLPADRLLIVEGERVLPGVTGVRASELVQVANTSSVFADKPISHKLAAPWLKDKKVVDFTPSAEDEPSGRSRGYTTIALTGPLRYSYRRSTVVIRGNVAHATHGETRDEVLGSGDASVPEQRFMLRQGPRTWESAPTPTGIASSLAVRVSGVLWPEVPSSALPGPRDEVVRSRTLGDRRDELRGGDGRRGARFPTGIENLTAKYRVGLGAAGNVGSGLITQLVTRPMGVREVVNPLQASGGADADGRDEIRERIPIAARGIDRLVSVADHADFALNFAGVDKSIAHLIPAAADLAGGGATIGVVIAGDEDVAIAEDSDLLRNLRLAFRRYGDPLLRTVVWVATPVPLLLQAGVRIDPRHEWARVEAALRERLYQRHGWDRRAIGEAARLSIVLEALQSVDGVQSIDVDLFGPLRPAKPPPSSRPAPGTPPPPAPTPSEALWLQLGERVAGLTERLRESRSVRRWTFAARPAEVLYFARSAPANVSFSEVAS